MKPAPLHARCDPIREEIARRWTSGEKIEAISAAIGLEITTIGYHRRRMGLASRRRAGKLSNLTREDYARMREAMSMKQMAHQLGVTHSAISHKARREGWR